MLVLSMASWAGFKKQYKQPPPPQQQQPACWSAKERGDVGRRDQVDRMELEDLKVDAQSLAQIWRRSAAPSALPPPQDSSINPSSSSRAPLLKGHREGMGFPAPWCPRTLRCQQDCACHRRLGSPWVMRSRRRGRR
ncbi:unnamed protein product, partial [Polarella glacialis]